MIPASYLFKDIYRQHWEEADTAPAAIEKSHRFVDGLVTPIAAIAAIFSRRKPLTRPLRRHAYE
ncbi:hypothetical protein [Devosia sp.]|uniref:hypothetical protein n=1 Tax=Devosia sp. TaxID=1871048 RepID=UPI002FCC11A2